MTGIVRAGTSAPPTNPPHSPVTSCTEQLDTMPPSRAKLMRVYSPTHVMAASRHGEAVLRTDAIVRVSAQQAATHAKCHRERDQRLKLRCPQAAGTERVEACRGWPPASPSARSAAKRGCAPTAMSLRDAAMTWVGE